MPVLTTERLRLDEMTDADLDDIAAMVADPAVMRVYPAPLDRVGAQRVIDRNRQRYAELGFGLWTVRTRDRGIERVVAIVHHENLPSQRVALAAGLQLERVLDHGGRPHHLYAVGAAAERAARVVTGVREQR